MEVGLVVVGVEVAGSWFAVEVAEEEMPQIGSGMVVEMEKFGTGEVEVEEKAGTGWVLEVEEGDEIV